MWQFVRSQLSGVNVLSFTELPEDRSVEIAYTIGEMMKSRVNDLCQGGVLDGRDYGSSS